MDWVPSLFCCKYQMTNACIRSLWIQLYVLCEYRINKRRSILIIISTVSVSTSLCGTLYFTIWSMRDIYFHVAQFIPLWVRIVDHIDCVMGTPYESLFRETLLKPTRSKGRHIQCLLLKVRENCLKYLDELFEEHDMNNIKYPLYRGTNNLQQILSGPLRMIISTKPKNNKSC